MEEAGTRRYGAIEPLPTRQDDSRDRPGAPSLRSEPRAPHAQRSPHLARSLAGSGAAILTIAGFGVLYACVARYVLDAFPFAGDEYSVALQAKLFAHGLLRVPAPAHAEWLGVDHVVIDDWVRSKYPPGMAALLSLGERARARRGW